MIFSRRWGTICASALVFSLSAVSFPGVLYAQQGAVDPKSECTCLVPEGSAGLMSEPIGEIYASGITDRVTSDISLFVGSRVDTGPSGSATVNFQPDCKFSLPGSVEMVVEKQEDKICVRVIDDNAAALVGGLGGNTGTGLGTGLAASLGAVAIAGAAAMFIGLGNDEPVSKP